MAVWQVRTGFTKVCLNLDIIVAGWDLDVSGVESYSEVEELYRIKWPTSAERKQQAKVQQIWEFAKQMREGDYVLLPRDWEDTFSVGEVAGPFQCRPNLKSGARMTRPARWLARAVPRSEFDPDIRAALQPGPWVLEVCRPRIDERI